MEEFFKDKVMTSVDDLQPSNIKKVESMVRTSYEYRTWLAYLHNQYNFLFDDYFGYSDEDISMEVHHIVSLYSIVDIVGTHMLLNCKKGEHLTNFDIAKAVIEEHYSNNIPCIYLAKNLHEAYHSGIYELPKQSKFLDLGNYKTFVTKYKSLLPKSDLDKITYFLDDAEKSAVEAIYEKEEDNHS